jgi:hypothetical protein
MTTREDQPEALVGDVLQVVSQHLKHAELLSLLFFDGSHALASQAIDRSITGCSDDPCRGIVWDSLRWPGAKRLYESVLDSLFGQIKAPGRSD